MAPDARCAQRRHQPAGFGAQLLLGFDETPNLLVEGGIGAGARLLQLLDLRIDSIERTAHRRDQLDNRLLPFFELTPRCFLRLAESRFRQIEEGLIVPRQRIRRERAEGVGKFLLRVIPQRHFRR